MNPLLSVVMPTCNGEKFIAAALESVRGQREEGVELIVVDDGSTDRTLEIVRDFARLLPIRLVTPGRIGNWVAISNLGLREARSEWACFLHQDDLWLPGRIARLRAEIEKAEGALILHNAVFVGPDGEYLGPWTCPLPPGGVPPDTFIERLLIQDFIAMPSPVFRRDAAIDSGGLDENLWFPADWDLWLRLGALGSIRFIDETLAAFRIHPASQTAARRVQAGEWEQQLMTVLHRHLQGSFSENKSLQRGAMFSVALNSALSAAYRGDSVPISHLLRYACALRPSDWHRYFRDSRIVQRVTSRLRLHLLQDNKTRKTSLNAAVYSID